MPLIVLEQGAATDEGGGKFKIFVRDLNMNPKKKYEVGMRYIVLTITNTTDDVTADLEFGASFYLSSNLIKHRDTARITADDYDYGNILSFIDLNEATPFLDGANDASRGAEYKTPYYTEMNPISNNEITLNFTTDFKNLTFLNPGSSISFFKIILEYREMK